MWMELELESGPEPGLPEVHMREQVQPTANGADLGKDILDTFIGDMLKGSGTPIRGLSTIAGQNTFAACYVKSGSDAAIQSDSANPYGAKRQSTNTRLAAQIPRNKVLSLKKGLIPTERLQVGLLSECVESFWVSQRAPRHMRNRPVYPSTTDT